jgi:hypothetical protein
MIEYKNKQNQLSKGFTLIEMAVIIVIISAIVGSLMYGSGLLEKHKLRSIITEFNYYRAATLSFYSQFDQFPGDFNNASSMWPTCDGTPSRCNGNNDGIITLANGSQYQDEAIRAWQHLTLSAIIDGNFSGYHNTASENTPGTNVPIAKYGSVAWYFDHRLPGDANTIYTNTLIIGARSTGSINNSPFLTPSQLSSIDMKIDDGLPITGNVRANSDIAAASYNYGGGTVNASCGVSASNVYNNSATYINGILCIAGFRI